MAQRLLLPFVLAFSFSAAIGSVLPSEGLQRNKPGFCPPDYLITTCVVKPNACYKDDECSGTQKCCSEGCGRTCQNATKHECPRIDLQQCPISTCLSSSLGGFASDENGCPVCKCKNCPADKPDRESQCLVDPCRGATCSAFPDARCVPNYCGGCHADFYHPKTGLKVDCNERRGEKPGYCHPNYLITTCQVRFDACFSDKACQGSQKCCSEGCGRTCQNATRVQCPVIDQAKCPWRKCSSRGGYAVDANGCNVCQCKDCPNGFTKSQCLIDPCFGETCPAHPNAKCVANYCGKCRPEFFDNGLKVNCKLQGPKTLPPATSTPSSDCRLRNGSVVSDGTSFSYSPCEPCRCSKGQVFCAAIDCAPAPCANPEQVEGQCCRACPLTGVKCHSNEVYEAEGVSRFCAPTCDEPDKPSSKACQGSTERGCVCKPGFVRERIFGRCIEETTCPRPTCRGPNSEHHSPGPILITKCSYEPHQFPTSIFVLNRWPEGCYCKASYIETGRLGNIVFCIPKKRCPFYKRTYLFA